MSDPDLHHGSFHPSAYLPSSPLLLSPPSPHPTPLRPIRQKRKRKFRKHKAHRRALDGEEGEEEEVSDQEEDQDAPQTQISYTFHHAGFEITIPDATKCWTFHIVHACGCQVRRGRLRELYGLSDSDYDDDDNNNDDIGSRSISNKSKTRDGNGEDAEEEEEEGGVIRWTGIGNDINNNNNDNTSNMHSTILPSSLGKRLRIKALTSLIHTISRRLNFAAPRSEAALTRRKKKRGKVFDTFKIKQANHPGPCIFRCCKTAWAHLKLDDKCDTCHLLDIGCGIL